MIGKDRGVGKGVWFIESCGDGEWSRVFLGVN